MHIAHCHRRRVILAEIAEVCFALCCFAVPQVIIAADDNISVRQPLREWLIPANILSHAVDDLKDHCRLRAVFGHFVRHPFHTVNRRLIAVPGLNRKLKFLHDSLPLPEPPLRTDYSQYSQADFF